MIDSATGHAPAKATTGPKIPQEAMEFVSRLTLLRDGDERGELAKLRRAAGRPVGQAGGALGLFYRLLPQGTYWDEEIYLLIATLFAIQARRKLKSAQVDFGATMAALRAKEGAATLDRRMAILLDSDFDRIDGRTGGGSLSYRLRQAVRYAESHDVGVDWARLLADLLRWTDPERRVQKRWARSYYRRTQVKEDQGGED